MKQTITVEGTVKEVRTFSNFVTLFLLADSPEKFQGSLLRFTFDSTTCQYLLKWAQIEIGAKVAITRNQNDGIPRNRTYTFKVLKSQAIDFDEF